MAKKRIFSKMNQSQNKTRIKKIKIPMKQMIMKERNDKKEPHSTDDISWQIGQMARISASKMVRIKSAAMRIFKLSVIRFGETQRGGGGREVDEREVEGEEGGRETWDGRKREKGEFYGFIGMCEYKLYAHSTHTQNTHSFSLSLTHSYTNRQVGGY